MITEMIFALFLISPFLLGFLHARVSKRTSALLIYYRYFMSFNMIFAGLFVASRMLLDGPAEAQLAAWEFSPMFYLYGIAVLSIVLMGAFSLFSRGSILMAPAIVWSIFLALFILVNLIAWSQQSLELSSLMIVHLIYDFATLLIMLGFLWLLRQDIPH